ncbi:hypothetical protein ACEN2J_12685 [Pseudorhodobacter sp. W20_MBD10_FR17]|uniref:hypothetical protein n=1 Tax=Pseudorhodobacter sp. W20_MBD10_FR17 TaxID=3240266 RepID=UPI003F9A247B
MSPSETISAEASDADPNRYNLEKLQAAAKLVEEVAYEQACYKSTEFTEYLILVAASLQRLVQRPDDFVLPATALRVVKD